jgi:3-oxoadipate enol-lactonase
MKAKINDIEIHYAIDGPEGAPVVACSHCLAGSLDIWEPQVRVLREHYRVLRFDTRGHGYSSAPDGEYTMDVLAEDAIGLFDALGIGQVHFMGISMGGMVAQTLALSAPDRCLSLILCDTTAGVPRDSAPVWAERIQAAKENGMAALADGTVDRWLSPEFQKMRPDTTRGIREMILKTQVPGFAGCVHAIRRFDATERLGELDLPVLVMVGENDPGTPVESAKELHGLIRNAELAVLPQAYHLSNIEAADAFNDRLTAFLNAR